MTINRHPFFAIVLVLALSACEPTRDLYPYQANPVIEIGPGLSQAFNYSQLTYAPKKDTRDSIAVLLVGSPRDTPITVTYTLEDGTATRPADYTVEGTPGETVIPAGKNLGYIRLKINPVSVLKTFTIRLKSATDVPVSAIYNNLLYGIASSPV
jgi:hypothetical protein